MRWCHKLTTFGSMPYWQYASDGRKVDVDVSQKLDWLKFRLMLQMLAAYIKNGFNESDSKWEDNNALSVGYNFSTRSFYAIEKKAAYLYLDLKYVDEDGKPVKLKQNYFMTLLLMTTGLAATTLSAAAYAISAAGAGQRKTRVYG